MKILLGICGSISAYKAPWIVRELKRRGAEVKVVMTPTAGQFVAPLALQNVSQNPVIVDSFDSQHQQDGSWHVHLARWCDRALVAPCSATTMAKLASGLADSALALVLLSLPRQTPLYLAPAMDPDLWLHPSTQRNARRLEEDGVHLLEPAEGQLASGLYGPGRLAEPVELADWICRPSLRGVHALITAGPTYERIDTVRFLGNDSTGKMGYALATEAAQRGAEVTLVSGPVSLAAPLGVRLVQVESARQMLEACQQHSASAQVIVKSAAVADFTPVQVRAGKLKKEEVGDSWSLELRRNPDILAWLGEHKQPGQLLVGFALETDDAQNNARKKLAAKNCDLIVLNEAGKPNSGFGGDLNTVTLMSAQESLQLPTMSKRQCAAKIWDHLESMLGETPR